MDPFIRLDDVSMIYGNNGTRSEALRGVSLAVERGEYVGITGGEPTLRKDMVEIVRVMADEMPRLRKMTLNTNGFVKDRVVKTLEGIIDVANEPLHDQIALVHSVAPVGLHAVAGAERGVCSEKRRGRNAVGSARVVREMDRR